MLGQTCSSYNPVTTDWSLYKYLLSKIFLSVVKNISTVEDQQIIHTEISRTIYNISLNKLVQKRQDQATSTFIGGIRSSTNFAYTSSPQQDKKLRKVGNRQTIAKRTQQTDEKVKRNLQKEFCKGINDIPSAARIHKDLAKTHKQNLTNSES